MHNKQEWPKQPDITETPEAESEILSRKEKQILVKEEKVVPDQLEMLLEKFLYWKMVRITAFVMRFIAKCRGDKMQDVMLTSEEIESAELHWIRKAQQSEELKSQIDLKEMQMVYGDVREESQDTTQSSCPGNTNWWNL